MSWSGKTSKLKGISPISKINGYIYRISRAIIGKQFTKAAILIVTTTGRKSARKRSVPLTAIPYGSPCL
jgi:hypothetical protein